MTDPPTITDNTGRAWTTAECRTCHRVVDLEDVAWAYPLDLGRGVTGVCKSCYSHNNLVKVSPGGYEKDLTWYVERRTR